MASHIETSKRSQILASFVGNTQTSLSELRKHSLFIWCDILPSSGQGVSSISIVSSELRHSSVGRQVLD